MYPPATNLLDFSVDWILNRCRPRPAYGRGLGTVSAVYLGGDPNVPGGIPCGALRYRWGLLSFEHSWIVGPAAHSNTPLVIDAHDLRALSVLEPETVERAVTLAQREPTDRRIREALGGPLAATAIRALLDAAPLHEPRVCLALGVRREGREVTILFAVPRHGAEVVRETVQQHRVDLGLRPLPELGSQVREIVRSRP